MKLDLLTNATVVDDAIRFVSENQSKNKEYKSVAHPENDEGEQVLSNQVY
jgi:hypothetical protein